MSTPATPPPATRPTVVLVHDAFTESASWNGVIAELARHGYRSLAVANPLRGLGEDARYLRSVLHSVGGPIVLAGHSYGGTVISEAADGHPDVQALVYVASFQLEPGESTGDLTARFPGGELEPALQPAPYPSATGGTGSDLYLRPDRFPEVFAADLPADVADLMAATQRPVEAAALEGRATRAAWRTIPSWSLIPTRDLTIPADAMRFTAQRAGSTTVEVDASHAVMVSQPVAVADVIRRAAAATADRRAA